MSDMTDVKAKIQAARKAGKKIPRGVIRKMRIADARRREVDEQIRRLQEKFDEAEAALTEAKAERGRRAQKRTTVWAEERAKVDAL